MLLDALGIDLCQVLRLREHEEELTGDMALLAVRESPAVLDEHDHHGANNCKAAEDLEIAQNDCDVDEPELINDNFTEGSRVEHERCDVLQAERQGQKDEGCQVGHHEALVGEHLVLDEHPAVLADLDDRVGESRHDEKPADDLHYQVGRVDLRVENQNQPGRPDRKEADEENGVDVADPPFQLLLEILALEAECVLEDDSNAQIGNGEDPMLGIEEEAANAVGHSDIGVDRVEAGRHNVQLFTLRLQQADQVAVRVAYIACQEHPYLKPNEFRRLLSPHFVDNDAENEQQGHKVGDDPGYEHAMRRFMNFINESVFTVGELLHSTSGCLLLSAYCTFLKWN